MPETAINLSRLPPFDRDGALHVVVETPKGSRNKYGYEADPGAILLKKVLPEGMSFPHDFGMIPGTIGADGDPIDVLILLDAPAFPGCVVAARLLGAIEAEQREGDGPWERNDRLVAVATHAPTHDHVRALADLRPGLLDEVEAFFVQYNRLAGRDFRPLRRSDAAGARALVEAGIAAFAAGGD
ncbi:inorganic diphosphatase [Methylobacterium sp. NEAU 140]|uniref:inorganic diphosphatase n=1 Tax=Methylobacterium sp. NEAU 140 TaxID=3064945 RepID=UPI0027335C9F|nr:inorganic diphosphatase [Methylobacterium sp. NEAU 140]MDP4025442.1 inorganic diphosphatase [Methylobacterium sp. NEAU 140]